MRQDKHCAIGVDIGGTKIAFVLIDEEGSIIEAKRIPTQLHDGHETILTNIGQQINQLLQDHGSQVMGVGVATPGFIDTQSGIVRNAVNLKWKDVPVIDVLRKSIPTSLPVFMQRDTAAETLGEYYFGAGENCKNFVFLGIGTGFGAGAISSGNLLTGSNNLALEIGHLSVDRNGPLCGCGNRGCIETLLSGSGLVKRAIDLYTSSKNPISNVSLNAITTKQIIALAKAHDPIADSLIRQMAESLGFICAMLKTVLDPERFIIGGGLGKAIFNMITTAAEQEMTSRTLKIEKSRTTFYKSSLETSAMGAASLVWYFNNLFPESNLFVKQ